MVGRASVPALFEILRLTLRLCVFLLVPKLCLGTRLLKKLCFFNASDEARVAKPSFAAKCVPKQSLGTSQEGGGVTTAIPGSPPGPGPGGRPF